MSTHSDASTNLKTIAIASIRTDPASQSREKIRTHVVNAYATAMTEQLSEGGLRFPPVVLFGESEPYYIGDGFHRILAARKAGLMELQAEVRPGSERDALLFAVSCNAEHGLPRTSADKRKAVLLLLVDPEWAQWSDREIGRRCQVSYRSVARFRKGLSGQMYQMRERKVKRGGVVYEMKTHPGPSEAREVRERVAQTDSVGLPLPSSAAAVFSFANVFEEAAAMQSRLAELVDRIGQSPAGEVYRQELIPRMNDGRRVLFAPELEGFVRKLSAAAPHCSFCPLCQPQPAIEPQRGCKLCGGRGWLSKGAFDRCSASQMEDVQRRRRASQPRV